MPRSMQDALLVSVPVRCVAMSWLGGMEARDDLFGSKDAELGQGPEGRDRGDEGFCQCTSR